MALLNPNFADEGTAPGLAANWILSASTALEEVAGFGNAPEMAWEDFERWHDFVERFEAVTQARAFFAGVTLGYEAFARGWGGGVFVAEFSESQLETAAFSAIGTETFDGNWSNASFFSDWNDVGSTAALFDGEAVEDFETQWRNNQSFVRDWNSFVSEQALFDSATASAETFNGTWPTTTSI